MPNRGGSLGNLRAMSEGNRDDEKASEGATAPEAEVAREAPAKAKAAWAAPLDRLDRGWTRLEARLCAFVIALEILTLVFWISMKALSSPGGSGPGLVWRCLFAAAVSGAVAHRLARKHPRGGLVTGGAMLLGLLVGRAWGDAGSGYFANLFSWLQNASILVFFGGVSELAKRLTLWLALLGASVATGQGKHITVDVVLRLVSPRARVPVAVLGWLTAAIVSGFAAWGFFDNLAVEEFHVQADAKASVKIERVIEDAGRNVSLAGRQLSLDVRSLPKVLSGTPYAKWMTAAEWNTWLRSGDWSRFKAEDVKAFELPEDGSIDFRTPAVTAVPGATEQVRMLLTPLLNLVFPFGLLVVALRFLVRCVLAITGWVEVDPDAAHGDADLEHAHDGATAPTGHRDPVAADAKPAEKKGVRAALGAIGGIVAVLTAVGGPIVGGVVLLALLGTPLFAILGGASELAWITHHDPSQQFLRRLAPEVFGSRFAGSPILTTIPLFTFVGYLMAESKTPERLVRAATACVGWLPGGLAIVCVLASAVFTLFTGGSGVTIIAVGGLLYPALRQKGYDEKFALGLVTTGGSLGLLLPLSLPLLIYAMVTGLDFKLVNKAVVLPGALVLAFFAAYSIWYGVRNKLPRAELDLREIAVATWGFKWELGLFVLLGLSIASGMADIDEAAGLVALYILVVEVWIHRDLSLKKDLVKVAKGAMALAGAVILILAMANALINYVVQEHLPDRVLEAMLRVGLDKTWQFLLVMNVFLLVLGMVMDGLSAILVAVPLVLPFAAHFGLGPFHVAMMFVLNLELAFSCPPLGLNLFISSFRFNRPVVSLYRIAMPFVGLLAAALLVIMYVPRISNQRVLADIQEWRDKAVREKRPPREAWLLECVQQDRANPLPCTEEDKKAYPNGQLPPKEEVKPTTPVVKADAGADDEDDLAALIAGGGAKAADAGAKPADDSEDDLAALIGGAGKKGDAGAEKPKPAPGNETEDDLADIIRGKK